MMTHAARWSPLTDLCAALAFRIALATAILFLLLPIIVSVVLSFDDRQFLGAFPPTRFSLRWYRNFLDNPAYFDGLVMSLKLANSMSTAGHRQGRSPARAQSGCFRQSDGCKRTSQSGATRTRPMSATGHTGGTARVGG